MSQVQDRPMSWYWPPVIYAGCIVLALLLSYFTPLPWLFRPLSDFAFAAGIVVAIGAAWIILAAGRTLDRANTTVLPTRRADHLVTKGPFSFTRNPIYLGMTMLLIAAGLVLGMLWFLAAAILASFLTQKIAIEAEEKHLELRFGKTYRDYRKRVRRWV